MKMIKLIFKTCVVSSLLFLYSPYAVHSESIPIFITNYDVNLSIGTNDMSLRNSAIKVRSGDAIPYVDFNQHKVELTISELSENRFSLETVILKKSQNKWNPINWDIPKHEGELGTPLKLFWKGGEYLLDVALVVGIAPS
jgi:hypothetical protein